ncbi:META domain-containing protein [Streptomyces sp. NPDC093546]|uniref:META domain-containing protein n=1 Tax=Streptomyces sp. NPDC093546 TaxID=3366040 RepID=UPI0037F541BB
MPTTHKHNLTASAALVALLALTACGTEPGSGASDGGGSGRPDVPVTGVHWAVDSVTVDGREHTAPARAHVQVDAKGKVTGNYGCNHFNARADIDGDTITISDPGMTEMACEGNVQSFEDALRSALDGPLKAALDKGRLTLTTAQGDTVVLSERRPAPLTGTTWTVESLTSGQAASSLPAGAEGKAHFTVTEDGGKDGGTNGGRVRGKEGSIRGNLGCNSFTATVTTEGQTITFGRVTSTRKLCPGPAMDVERALLKVMEGTATYTIDHRTLTLTAPDGTGFAARASEK